MLNQRMKSMGAILTITFEYYRKNRFMQILKCNKSISYAVKSFHYKDFGVFKVLKHEQQKSRYILKLCVGVEEHD